MRKNKTEFTQQSVNDFLKTITDQQKMKDSYDLVNLMEKVSAEKARMWGTSIIGFGEYHYRYESGHEGSAPLIGFSPRKSAISLYIFTDLEKHRSLLNNLGKFKMGKSCIYVKKISDINTDVLVCLMQHAIAYITLKYKRKNNNEVF